jgi:hypothetical protein
VSFAVFHTETTPLLLVAVDHLDTYFETNHTDTQNGILYALRIATVTHSPQFTVYASGICAVGVLTELHFFGIPLKHSTITKFLAILFGVSFAAWIILFAHIQRRFKHHRRAAW